VTGGSGAVTEQVPIVLNDAGVIGLSLNGKSFPATAPVMAHVGDWVEMTYFNEGLMIHPMHLHGLPQLVIGKDGFPLPAPYQADTIAVAPGQRYTVPGAVTSDFPGRNGKPGVWAVPCPIPPPPGSDPGMFGMVTTFIVLPPPVTTTTATAIARTGPIGPEGGSYRDDGASPQ